MKTQFKRLKKELSNMTQNEINNQEEIKIAKIKAQDKHRMENKDRKVLEDTTISKEIKDVVKILQVRRIELLQLHTDMVQRRTMESEYNDFMDNFVNVLEELKTIRNTLHYLYRLDAGRSDEA